MRRMVKRISIGISTMAMVAMSLTPAFAATDLIISGNGSNSTSDINLDKSNTTWVSQSNSTQIDNNVDINGNTGGNTADGNTGGDVRLETGDSDARVTIDNFANHNVASVESCDCADDTQVIIDGNGTRSDNFVSLDKTNTTTLFQTNVTDITNTVDADLETGFNDAEDNTGGDVVLLTGDADARVNLLNFAGSNVGSISPSNGDGGSTSILVRGNGSNSDNVVDLDLDHSTWVDQLNETSIDNDVDVDAQTGWNDIEDNTGGFTALRSGDADTRVLIDNMAGFNFADVEGCCFDDITAKVSGNGTGSYNLVEADLQDDNTVWQDNVCGGGNLDSFFFSSSSPCFDNDVEVDADTGNNDGEDNTSGSHGDPMVLSGDSFSTVQLGNQGGANHYGSGSSWQLPSLNGQNISLSFDIADVLRAMR